MTAPHFKRPSVVRPGGPGVNPRAQAADFRRSQALPFLRHHLIGNRSRNQMHQSTLRAASGSDYGTAVASLQGRDPMIEPQASFLFLGAVA